MIQTKEQTMKQVVMNAPGKINVQQVAIPQTLNPGEVLLRIKKIGICGSDIHTFHGEHPAVVFPVIQGHEYSGIIEKVGPGVEGLKPGMRVTGRPQQVCGRCASCKRGDYNICQNLKVEGFQAPGVAQEFFKIPADRVVPFSDKLSLDHGAMIEPAAVAAHATQRTTSLKGKNVVVSGAGTIGNLVAQYAYIRGAKKVVITDISDYRLKIAEQCGIEGTINVKTQSFEEGIQEHFGEEGFQVGFEAAGVASALDGLVKKIENGGQIVIIGVYAQNPVVDMYYLGEHELQLTGSLMYKQEDYLKAVHDMEAGTLHLDPLISGYFPLEEFESAYRFIENSGDQVMKVLLNV